MSQGNNWGFHRTFAADAACQQRTLTPLDTWSCPTLELASVLMSRLISPELVLFPDFWVSNIPRYFCFAFKNISVRTFSGSLFWTDSFRIATEPAFWQSLPSYFWWQNKFFCSWHHLATKTLLVLRKFSEHEIVDIFSLTLVLVYVWHFLLYLLNILLLLKGHRHDWWCLFTISFFPKLL